MDFYKPMQSGSAGSVSALMYKTYFYCKDWEIEKSAPHVITIIEMTLWLKSRKYVSPFSHTQFLMGYIMYLLCGF